MVIERFQAGDMLGFTAMHIRHSDYIPQVGQDGIGIGGRSCGTFPRINDILGHYGPAILEPGIWTQVECVNRAIR